MTAPLPVAVEPEELAEWSERVPLAFRLALFLARRSPRGQGWFPRFIGRHACRRMKLVLRTQSGARIAVDPRSLDYYTLMLKQDGIVDARVRNACLRVLGGATSSTTSARTRA